jgi:putative aldouronate transport system substrate-binding protein
MKKFVLVLSALFFCGIFVFAAGGSQSTAPAAGGTGPVEFSATFIKGVYHGDPNDMILMKTMANEANVKINWMVIPGENWNERKNILINSGDMPDVFYMNTYSSAEQDRYGRQGLFLDLTDAINQNAPNLKKRMTEYPIFKAMITNPSDGKIYSVGKYQGRAHNQLVGSSWVYQPWLDKLNIKMPTTYLEFEDMLRQFKTKDPNGNGKADEYPFVFANGWSGNSSYQNLFAMFGFGYKGIRGGDSFVEVDGKAIFVPGTERFKEAIVWLHKLFAEGLLAEEDYAARDRNLFNAKNYSDTVVAGGFQAWWNSASYVPEDRVSDYTLISVPLKGPHDDQIYMQNSRVMGDGSGFIVTNKGKDRLPAIMRWLDTHFDPMHSIEVSLGPVGTNIEKRGDIYGYVPVPAGSNYNQFRYGQTPCDSAPFFIPETSWGTVVEYDNDEKQRMPWLEVLRPYLTQFFVYSYPIEEETRFIQGQGTEIETYIQTTQAKWLMQGGIEREWDAFQAQLKTMGIDQYTKVMQSQVDRFNQFMK